MNNTVEYIQNHILRVQSKMSLFAKELMQRGFNHDKSKLEEPELSGWTDMDKEPKFPYDSKEYYNKKKKYQKIFEHHYLHNRHHPDKWNQFPFCPDLLDLIEMLCDWISYRDNITYEDAKEIIKQQSEKFGFSEELASILENTLVNYYISVDGLS